MFLITLNNLCTDKQHEKFYKNGMPNLVYWTQIDFDWDVAYTPL